MRRLSQLKKTRSIYNADVVFILKWKNLFHIRDATLFEQTRSLSEPDPRAEKIESVRKGESKVGQALGRKVFHTAQRKEEKRGCRQVPDLCTNCAFGETGSRTTHHRGQDRAKELKFKKGAPNAGAPTRSVGRPGTDDG